MVLKLRILMLTAGPIGGLFFFNSKKDSSMGNKDMKTMTSGDSSMLCRFVLDMNGKKIGESISVNQDLLIVKSGSRFLGIPLKHVEVGEKTLLVKGLLDVTKAYELGEKWQKESFREMSPHAPETKQ